ncbi:MAG: phosphoserine phosphatase SerB [Alphaproteobacteria bacterium TMED93]|nr:MAG: phosphoserine phosphatase SerB [Alphaproteobacteria bacterium TMED93]|tara:strand:+ start:1060 stop:1962 length:903 start_codon:yes stop_codon:yes gene_type:complete
MSKKNFTAVITLVSINQLSYATDNNYINNIIKKYNIKILKTNKLSKLVKDFFFKVDLITFKNLKKAFKSHLFKGSDICIQENKYRKKKVIACDMDKTIINIETIDLIGEKILNNNKIAELTKEAMSGGINYNSSIIQRTKFLKGISINEIKKTAKYIKFTKDADVVIKTLNSHGCHTMLISGGYEIFANIIGKKIGFKEIISNVPISKNGVLTGSLKGSIVDGKGKLSYLRKRIKTLDVKKKETIAIGDGQNDIDMIKYAGLGIAWNGFPKVKNMADVLAGYDFKSILYFQGYSREDIKF